MRLIDTNTKDTLTGQKTGTGETRGYKFDANNAFFFKSMIDSLYADKVASVVREIIANAFDAHAMSRPPVTRAVEVSLPTMFSPKFSVRDFGPGMSHEFVMDLYTTLGHSSKTNTNAATGMFGLGAKTPFAVSDAFEVRVFDGAEQRIYQCSFAQNGCPELTHVSTIPSTEPSGVLVSMPITDRGRQSEFERAINAAGLCYFDKEIKFNRPSTTGDSFLDLARQSVVKTGNNFFTRKNNGTGRTSGSTILVRQGFAVYPLDLNKLGLRFTPGYLANGDILRSIVDTYTTEVMVDCPIGTFEVTPSRELIQYTDYSIKNLKTVVADALTSARETLFKQAKDAKNVIELVRNLAGPNDDLTNINHVQSLQAKMDYFGEHVVKNFAKWAKSQGLPICDRMSYSNRRTNGFDSVLSDYGLTGKMRHGAFGGVEWGNSVKATLKVGVTCYDGATAKVDDHCAFDRTNDTSISPTEIVILMPNDVRLWEDKVHHYIRNVQKTFSLDKVSSLPSIVFRGTVADLAVVQEWLEAHHCLFHVVPASVAATFVDPPQAIATRANRVVKPRPAQNDAYRLDRSMWVEEKNVDFTKPCYIVIRDRRHGSIEIADTATADAFDKKKIGGTASFHGLRLRGSLAESSLITAVRAARDLSLLDDATPVYSLRRAQYDTLVKAGTTLPLLSTFLAGHIEGCAKEALSAITMRALLAHQDWSAGNTATLRTIVRAAPNNAQAAKLASELVTDILAVTRLAAHSIMAMSYGDALCSPTARDFAANARRAASKHDDFLNTMCTNYSSFVSAHHTAITVPHLGTSIYPLLIGSYSETRADNADWMAEALDYIDTATTKRSTRSTTEAMALLNALPPSLRTEIAGEIKVIRDYVSAAVKKFTKAAPAVTKTVTAA